MSIGREVSNSFKKQNLKKFFIAGFCYKLLNRSTYLVQNSIEAKSQNLLPIVAKNMKIGRFVLKISTSKK